MLMHSCYCVFISVTGGFVQMLKDLKNLLKLSLKILFIKTKKENFLPFLLSSDSARWFSSFRSAQLRAQPSPAAARSAPARQLPRPAADARAPSVGAAPNLPHPAPAPGQGGTAATTRVVGASPRSTASLKGSRDPPRTPAAFSPLSFRTCSGRRSRNNRRSTRRIHRARAAVPVASPSRLALSRALP